MGGGPHGRDAALTSARPACETDRPPPIVGGICNSMAALVRGRQPTVAKFAGGKALSCRPAPGCGCRHRLSSSNAVRTAGAACGRDQRPASRAVFLSLIVDAVKYLIEPCPVPETRTMAKPATTSDAEIASFRAFNRFYTRQLGLLKEGVLESSFSLTEVRVLYELAHRDDVRATDLASDLGLDQ